MCYSNFTQRIAGDGVATWDIHYRMLARVEQGEEVLLLLVGDPDFDTPAPIVQSTIDSLLAGNTHYADVRGKHALHQRIAECHRQRGGWAVDMKQVVVLAGAQCALYAVVQCLLNPGDEVIVAEPMYVAYGAVFGACGAWVVPVPMCSENDFRVQVEETAVLITSCTRAMVLNSPYNPSGVSLSWATWEVLAELCTAHDPWTISDEVYSELLFDGEHVSPASLLGMVERTATLSSPSRSHTMTGWWVGRVVDSAALYAHLESLALCMLYGSPELIQDAVCIALEVPLPELETMREAYHRHRGLVIECLADSPGLRPLHSDGGMFVTADIHPTGLPARAFADRLLDRHGISVLAGETFGLSVAGHIRLGLVLGAKPLCETCRRIALCAAGLLGQA